MLFLNLLKPTNILTPTEQHYITILSVVNKIWRIEELIFKYNSPIKKMTETNFDKDGFIVQHKFFFEKILKKTSRSHPEATQMTTD